MGNTIEARQGVCGKIPVGFRTCAVVRGMVGGGGGVVSQTLVHLKVEQRDAERAAGFC